MKLSRTQIAETYGYSRQHVYKISIRDDFPAPVVTDRVPLWDFDDVEHWFKTWGRESALYDPDNLRRKRPHVAGVRLTTPERDYYVRRYGSAGAAIRHLVNEDQRRIHEQR